MSGWAPGLDHALRIASVPAWLACVACLSPAVLRMLRGRGRYLDPIWAIVFLLAINRLLFLTRVSLELSHATALVLAVVMAAFSLWYQRRDG